MWDSTFETIIRPFLPLYPATEPLAEDTDLRDHGLDSLAIVELLAALENAYDVRFVDDALSLENFSTPSVLWKTLSALR